MPLLEMELEVALGTAEPLAFSEAEAGLSKKINCGSLSVKLVPATLWPGAPEPAQEKIVGPELLRQMVVYTCPGWSDQERLIAWLPFTVIGPTSAENGPTLPFTSKGMIL